MLCLKSLRNRTFIAGLTIFSIALSVALILGVERLRTQAREGFTNSASGIDLIVAARGNDVQILLSTVFGVGSTGTGISWDSFEMLLQKPQIAWAVPIMTGDNHRGYPVIGTSAHYFDHFRHSGGQSLAFQSGAAFTMPEGAVVGAEVAANFGYVAGTEIINAHGSGEVAFDVHDEAPFTVTGVLAPTGTAVDRMVFVSLEGFDALHEDTGAKPADPFAETALPQRGTDARHEQDALHADHEASEEHDDHAHDDNGDHDEHDAHLDQGNHGHEPNMINAVFVGMADRSAVLSIQRAVADYRDDALTAVLPNVALLQLWEITGTAETALRLMAGAVALAGVIGMLVMLSATLETRRREFAILRSVGATPMSILGLIVLEAILLLFVGIALGYGLLTIVTFVADPVLSANLGLRLGHGLPTLREGLLIVLVFCSGLIASAVPAVRVYRMTLNDGLSMRL